MLFDFVNLSGSLKEHAQEDRLMVFLDSRQQRIRCKELAADTPKEYLVLFTSL
jgi:hypothetical protein